MIKRALISVSDKTGIIEFAKEITSLGVEIISTGGTAKLLVDNGIKVIPISEVTGFSECLDGRVKTLHPNIHAAILAKRDNIDHMNKLKELGIGAIDMVVVNLYPFEETILKEGVAFEECIENIDIGGPTLLRAAAKNYKDIVAIIDSGDYSKVMEELYNNEEVSIEMRYNLACKVFKYTSNYDAAISRYLNQGDGSHDSLPETELNVNNISHINTFMGVNHENRPPDSLRYGENPHQKAYYKNNGMLDLIQLHGKELSFNNINDANGAIELIKEFDEPTVVAVKHTNPCGVASSDNIIDAYKKAYEADAVSIYGGIIAVNRQVDIAVAEEMSKIFIEVIIAPSFTPSALEKLKLKKNLRILELKNIADKLPDGLYDMKKVLGGILIQEYDNKLIDEEELKYVTQAKPTELELEDLFFAMKVAKHTKSNAIVIAKNKQTVGIGPGQTNRITALNIAVDYAKDKSKGAVLASDAFFPFNDCVIAAHNAGVKSIIQPGGSIRDEDSIDKCNEYGISMIFTGMRHFKH